MLFDLGWSEILLIGTVALVFIGPKDLPKAMRVAGYWVRKARTLSREFQSGIDQMIREAELDEMRQELKKAAEFDLNKEFQHSIDPTGSLREGLTPPELPNFAAARDTTAATGGAVGTIGGTPVADAELVSTAQFEAAPAAPAGLRPLEPPPAPAVPGPAAEPDRIAPDEPHAAAAPRPEPGAGADDFQPPKP